MEEKDRDSARGTRRVCEFIRKIDEGSVNSWALPAINFFANLIKSPARRMTAKGLRALIPSFSAESRVIFRTDPLPGDRVNPPAEHPPSGVQIAGYRMAAQKHHTTTGDR